MSPPHLTADQADRFHRADLDIEELTRIMQHLDACPQCRGQYLAEPVDTAAVRKMEADLLLMTWARGEHLPDEQIIAFAEGSLDPEEQQEVSFHLERCASCRAQAERIRALHGLLMEQRESVVSPLSGVTVRDTSGSISLQGDRMRLEDARKLRPMTSRWISRLLTEGSVAPSKALNGMLSLLKGAATPAPALRSRSHSLVAPVNTVLRSSPPRFRWLPVSDAAEYSVVVMQVTRENSKLIWKGNMGNRTEGSLPPEVALEPKQLYLWQVTATIHPIQTRSAFAWFSILSADAAAEIAQIEREHANSALILLGACEQHGLYEEAHAHLHRLMELNPDSDPIRNIAQKLDRQRGITEESTGW